MKLSICIPVYNNYNLTKSCLKDLSFLTDDSEVIIFDNNSTDETINLLNLQKNELPKNFKYIRSENNLGFGIGSNKAYQESQGEYILFLNNDIRVKSNHINWVKNLIDGAEDGSIVGPTGGLLDKDFNFIRETNKIENGNSYLSGWCLCAKKETFDKLILSENIGPFDSRYFVFHEDTDLSFRAKELLIPLKIIDVPVIHFGHMTAKKCNMSKLYLESRAIFEAKWKTKL